MCERLHSRQSARLEAAFDDILNGLRRAVLPDDDGGMHGRHRRILQTADRNLERRELTNYAREHLSPSSNCCA